MEKLFLKRSSSRLIQVILPVLLIMTVPSSASCDEYEVVIYKKNQNLVVKNGDHIIKAFHIATGKGGNGAKRYLGDKKTPIGVYRIIDFKADSKFYFFMLLDYPNLIDAWYGYKNEVITAGEFKKIATAYKNNKVPPQDTALGGYIGIHGLGSINEQKLTIHRDFNWTEGCIAMTNEQIDELKQYVKIGTPVLIQE